jgi:hypothetical protein
MKCCAHARLGPIGRQLLVDRVVIDGWPVQAVAEAAGVSVRTADEWLARWRVEWTPFFGHLGACGASRSPC